MGKKSKYVNQKLANGDYLSDRSIQLDILRLVALACDILEELRDDTKLRKDDGR